MSRTLEVDADFAALARTWDSLRAAYPTLQPKRRFEAISFLRTALLLVLRDVTDSAGILGGGHNGHTPEEHTWSDEDEAALAAKQERARRLSTRPTRG